MGQSAKKSSSSALGGAVNLRFGLSEQEQDNKNEPATTMAVSVLIMAAILPWLCTSCRRGQPRARRAAEGGRPS